MEILSHCKLSYEYHVKSYTMFPRNLVHSRANEENIRYAENKTVTLFVSFNAIMSICIFGRCNSSKRTVEHVRPAKIASAQSDQNLRCPHEETASLAI